MELASCRALKEEAKERVRQLWQQPATVRALGVRAQNISRQVRPRTIALGISSATADDYKLAIRVQHPLLRDSEEVAALREMAKGEVDVRYIGHVQKSQGAPLQRVARPLRPGVSVGHYQITAGTLGAFAKDETQTMILSNNHVLANENKAAAGDHILQPGHFDGGTDPADCVATLTRFIPIDFANSNLVDCAVAGLRSGIAMDSNNLDVLGRLAGVRNTPLIQDEPVSKLGRTTAATYGTILATEMDNISIGYDAGDAVFNGQIEIQSSGSGPFSQGGDSGSLIVDANMQAIGLLFAGSDTGGPNNTGLTYANPIGAVLEALSIQLVI